MEENGAASFGAWLKRRRQALGLTQDALARRAGCATATIRKIEADERRPSVQVAERLADHLALAPHERAAFLRSARATLAADRLPAPARLPAHLPAGAVTFLLAALGDGSTAGGLRAREQARLQQTIAAHGGSPFMIAGDAICAAFVLPQAAAAAALAVQRALLHDMRGTSLARMALHTGVVAVQGGGYAGQALDRAARLLDAAHAGQILLSHVTEDLLGGDLPAGSATRDLGEHRLKDLARPERIYQLSADDLLHDFPPPKTLARYATNLPAPPTALIGRSREAAVLREWLAQPDVRLVTLTGPGGIGKTRLGLHVAADVLDQFPDGVYFVGLAAVRDASLLAGTIAQALGLKEAGDQPAREQLTAHLRDKAALLLLDNFEQLLGAAPQIAALLAEAPRLKMLITSRAALRILAEHEFVVPPLALPPQALAAASWETLSQYEAVALFIARALAVRPDFAVTNAQAPAIAEVCWRLDGLPLAIELAAARVRLFSPATLLARLRRPLDLLTGGARDLPTRQQTLRATIAWSYDLLEPDERRLFERLAVFVGGWTVEAAEAIWNVERGTLNDEPGTADVSLQRSALDLLVALLDKSMIRQEDGLDGEPRFVMLETIREFALEQLDRGGEPDTIQQRHAEYYTDMAELAEAGLKGAEQVRWLAALEAEHDNMRTALRWALGQPGAEGALRLAGALWRFWDTHGYSGEGRGWLEQALAHPACYQAPPTLWLKALNGAGTLARRQSDYVRATELFEQGLALSRASGETWWRAVLLNALGLTVRRQGDYARALGLLEESLALSRDVGDERGVTIALGNLGAIAHQTGDLARAAAYHAESLRRTPPDDQRGMAEGLNNLATVLHDQGDLARATELQEQSLALYRALGDRYGIALLLFNLSERLHVTGDLPRAREYLREALLIYAELGEQHGCVECLERFAGLAATRDQIVRAARLWGAAEAARMALGSAMSPLELAVHQRAVAAARAKIDQPGWEAAWAAGRALSLEGAIADALAQDG
jgi:predicted ATPase/class 3 adenylate cyclase